MSRHGPPRQRPFVGNTTDICAHVPVRSSSCTRTWTMALATADRRPSALAGDEAARGVSTARDECMSRFEINPNTREPYIQEPLRTSEPFAATSVPAQTDNGKTQPRQDPQPQMLAAVPPTDQS
jgi:hypothetical protein